MGEVVETRTKDPRTYGRTRYRYRVRWPGGFTFWYQREMLLRYRDVHTAP